MASPQFEGSCTSTWDISGRVCFVLGGMLIRCQVRIEIMAVCTGGCMHVWQNVPQGHNSNAEEPAWYAECRIRE